MFREIRKSEKITEKDQKRSNLIWMLADEPMFLRNGERNPRVAELQAQIAALEDEKSFDFDPDQRL